MNKKVVFMLLLLYGLTPLLWFQRGTMIAGGESATYLNMDYVAHKDIMSWNDKTSSINCEAGQIIFYRPWLLLRKLGLSKEVSQRFLWVLSFILMPFSIFYLFMSLKIPEKDAVVGGVIASTLYTYNLFATLMTQGHLLRYFHSFFPFIIAFYLRGLDSVIFKEKIRYAIYFALFFLGIGTTSANPPVMAPIFIVCFTLTLFYVHKHNYKSQINFILLTLGLTLLVNFFWLMNSYFYFFNVLSALEGAPNIVRWRWDSLREGKLYESFRLLGSWAFKNDIYFPWHPYYYGKSLYITFFSYLIPVLTFSALLFKPNRKIIIFSILAVFSLFLVKGINFPLGAIYAYFYNNYGWMDAFRSPWAKFNAITMLSYSVLLGYTSLHIFSDLKNKNKTISYLFVLIMIVSICITSFPMLTGDVVQTTVYRTMHSKEPDYWEELAKWFEKNDPDARVMSFPNTNYTSIYNWEHGITSSRPLAEYLIPNPHIHWIEDRFISSNLQMISKMPYSFISDQKIFNKYLELLRIRYILQQNDINYTHPDLRSHNIYSESIMRKYLAGNSNLIYIRSFGKLELYKVKRESSIIENDKNS